MLLVIEKINILNVKIIQSWLIYSQLNNNKSNRQKSLGYNNKMI